MKRNATVVWFHAVIEFFLSEGVVRVHRACLDGGAGLVNQSLASGGCAKKLGWEETKKNKALIYLNKRERRRSCVMQ